MYKPGSIDEQQLLEDINRYVPVGIDWKAGAISYLKDLIREKGIHNECYHLIKPFLGGPDFSPFFFEMYSFLNMCARLELPMKSSVLDVACGPGWVSHFMAKLGYRTFGFDISGDMIDAARKRIASDPFSTYCDAPLNAEFMIHDIEESPLPIDIQFDAAILGSALHHFHNPIRALRHIAKQLKPEGVLYINEGIAPEPDTPSFRQNLNLMTRYRTLERPYTREQLEKLLIVTGFQHYQFFDQINGYFDPESPFDRQKRVDHCCRSTGNMNSILASRTPDFLVQHISKSSVPVIDPLSRAFTRVPVTGKSLSRGYLLLRSLIDAKRQPEDIWFIVTLYRRLLGRNPDASGLKHFLNELAGNLTRKDVIRDFMRSAEFRGRYPD